MDLNEAEKKISLSMKVLQSEQAEEAESVDYAEEAESAEEE